MESDEPIGEQLSHLPDKVWRIWAVTLGMALILARFYYVQEQHSVVLSDLVETASSLKIELESVKTQTRTYQEGAQRQFQDLRERLN